MIETKSYTTPYQSNYGAHKLKIEFTGGCVLVRVVEIEVVFSCGVNDAGHIVRLQSDQPNGAIDQHVLHETRERLSFSKF